MAELRRLVLWSILGLSLWMLINNWIAMYAPHPASRSTTPAAATQDKRQPSDVPAASTLGTSLGSAAPVATPESAALPQGGTVKFTTDVFEAHFSLEGGQLQYLALSTYYDQNNKTQPLRLFNTQPNTYLFQSGAVLAAGQAPTHRTLFTLKQNDPDFDSTNKKTISFSAVVDGVELIHRYTFSRGSYAITFTQELRNQGGKTVDPSLYYQLVRDSYLPDGEAGIFNPVSFTGMAVYTNTNKYQKVAFPDLDKGKVDHAVSAPAGEDGWVAMVQHYFVSAIIPPSVNREIYTKKIGQNLYATGILIPLPTLKAGEGLSQSVTLYSGPQTSSVLETLAPGLLLVRDYGFLTIIAKPLFWLLEICHALLGNWGWAIVLLTILVKLAFYPVAAAGYKSMAKMKVLMPKVQALKERMGDDKLKLNQEMMKLYREEKVNPMGGCLPLLVQIPVFIALYWVLLSSVEMRGAPWLGWIQDLTQKDPYYILPVLMAVSMFIQSKLNPKPADPMQAKLMMYMPLVFSVMFIFFPSGLVLYWVVNNIISILQQWVITRRYETPPQAANDKVISS